MVTAKAPPESLEQEARKRVMVWFKDLYPHYNQPRAPFLRDQWERARDWALANGKKYHDYEAFLRNWVKKSLDSEGWKPRGPRPSKPIQSGRRYQKPRETTDDQENFSFLAEILKGEQDNGR